jgi:hypothetical protein
VIREDLTLKYVKSVSHSQPPQVTMNYCSAWQPTSVVALVRASDPSDAPLLYTYFGLLYGSQ